MRLGRWTGCAPAVTVLVALQTAVLTGCQERDLATSAATSITGPVTTASTAVTTPGDPTTAPSTVPPPAAPPAAPPMPTPPAAPAWTVGSNPLPLRPDGFGQVLPTPDTLVNRRLATVDRLPPPPDSRYVSTVQPVPASVLARSTWRPECPVRVAQLRYVTVSFWGFDGRHHTGELIVNATVADAVAGVFARLHAARFPIEEMRVTAASELDAPPTGDGNNTSAFVCRPARGRSSWSAHAYGLALDLNPFCNPYLRGDLVLPELASAYTGRGHLRPGMIQPGDPAVSAFAEAGWLWGGTWSSPRDLMHFSATGG